MPRSTRPRPPARRRADRRPGRPGLPSPLALLQATAVLAVAIVLGAAGAGATSAYLTSQTSVSGVTVTAGTAGLAVSGSGLPLSGLYPGQTVWAATTLTNTGQTTHELRAVSLTAPATPSAFAQSLTVSTFLAADAAACAAGTVVPGTSAVRGTFIAFAGGGLGGTLAPGASRTLCVAVTMAMDAASSAQAGSASFGVVIGGVQA